MDNEVVAPNPMLGSQLVCKSIVSPARMSSSQQQPCNGAKINKSASTQHSPTTTTSNVGQKQQDQKKPGAGQQQQQVAKSQTDTSTTTNTETSNSANKATKSQVKSISNTSSKIKSPTSTQNNNANNGQTDGVNSKKLKSVLCKAQEAQLQQVDHRPLETNEQNHQQQQQQAGGLSARESELLAKEAQDLKTKTRKLQLEIEEKNEIINVLKDELETLREQSDKYQRENLQLVKDAKRVKFLQDENDFLQDKVGSVEKLELEISRLKGKLNEVDFLKLRIGELEEDRQKAQEESVQFEDKWREAECKLTRVGELEIELNKWKSFSHELEQERNSIQSKLLESIEQESKLNSINKKVEDEVKRLRDLIKSYEEQRDEEQASNSLIMSVADLKRLDEEEQVAQLNSNNNAKKPVDVHDQEQQTDLARDTMEKSVGTEPCEVAEQANDLMKLDNENRELKKKLEMQTNTMDELSGSNRSIREELEGNRKLISDLRQDLACEKSLAKKLASQLSSFTKQIKSLDKQYFPIHDTSSTTVTNLEINSKLSGPPRTTTTTSRTSESSSSQTTATPTDTKESSLEKSVTSAASTTPTENRKEHHKLNAIQGGDDDQDDGRDKPTKNGEEKKSPLAAGDNKQQVESKSTAAAAKSTPAEELNAPNRGDYAKLNEQKRPSEQNTTGNNGRVQCEGDATGNTNVNGSRKSDRNFLDGLGEERRQQSRKEGEEEPELTTKAESARSSSSTYSSSALSSTAAVSSSPIINKSAPVVTIESFKIDKDTDESSRTKLASTTTTPTTTAATTSASATNYAINLAAARKTSANLTTKTVKKSQQQQHHEEHQQQQQQQEDRFDQQELARRTLFSPLIDSSEDELRAKRKHGQNNININGQHHKTVATASSLSSISPSSSARSQSSSPPSVAVTIGHDSGFQSINHDFNQLSPKSSSSSADSRHRDPHHHHHHQPHQQQLVALAQSNRSTPITGRIMQATSREILDGKCLTPTQFKQDSRPVASACSGSASASGQRRSSPLAAAATCATGQQVAANAEPVLSKSTPAAGTRTTSDGSQPNKQRRENQRPLLSAANVGVVGAPTLPSNRCANQTDASRASSSSSSSSPTNNNYNRTKLTLRDTNSLATTTTTATKTNNHVIDKNGSQTKDTGDEQTHKSSSSSSSSSSNFVRNSLPSRSVNFGHSKPTSAYLDRIRASVSATTTTSSSSSSTTNFNELSNNTRNLTLPEAGQHRPATVLNCMLDHQHVARCFVSSEAVLAPGRVQVTPREAPHQLLLGHPQLVGHPMHHHHYHQALSAQQQPAASRQLNALIDPVANEQLMLTMLNQQHQQQQHQQAHLHHQHHHVHPAAAPNQQHPMDQTKLTDEQIARLNNLHRQHYYHHLHQLHQMHHQVHLHHQMHHQQQNIGANQQEPSRCKPNNPPTVSQFYAPGGQYDEQQVYANMAANSSQQRPVGPINLVNHENNNNSNYLQRQEVSARSVVGLPRNPSTLGRACLPPIGEVNGLPVVHEAITTTRSSPSKSQQVTSSSTMPNNSTAKLARLSPSRQVNATKAIESPVQSASTSPTSSSSSSCHMSPSSATSSPSSSSSSSLNSLTASSALNRSSQCRHTTTNVELANRRQFSVERELINSTPMTATLSRVGSCRGMPTSTMLATTLSQQQQQQQHQQVRNNVNVDQMRNPVKLQQPPLMRTSKILNISAQQSAAGGQVNSANSMSLRRQQQHQQLTDGISALTNNLADIKLNDGLAFSSLRAPKKSSSGSNLNRSLNGNLVAGEPKCRLLVGPNGQRLSNSGSNSPEKQKQPARQPKSNQDKVEPNNNAKSSSVCR